MMYVITLSLITGALGIYYFLYEHLSFFKKHGIPYLRPLPFVGNMGPFLLRMQSITDLLKKVYNVHPEAKYIGLYDMTSPVVILRDPDLIKSVTLKHFDQFPNHRGIVRDDQDPVFARNLFTLQDDTWRQTRVMLSPAFTASKVKNMFKLISDYAVDIADFIAQLPENEKVIQTKSVFTRYTTSVIATCAFGISVDSTRDPKNPFYVYCKTTNVFNFNALVKFNIFRNLPWLAKIMKLTIVSKPVSKFFRELVETTVKIRDEKSIVRSDMLQLMMESRKKESKRSMTIEEMTSQAFSFFFSGFDSTSTLMCFAAHEIAMNEDVQKRLQDEIDKVLEDTNGQASYDIISNMEYLDVVVNEALRLYPIGVILDRVCVKDFEFPPTFPDSKPFTVKKGQTLWIPAYAIHRDNKYFEEPDKFNPSRFLGEEKKRCINAGTFLPFGLGPRMCIGTRFALIEIKLLFFHLLARCDLLPCEKTPIPIVLESDGFNMKPKGGFWIKAVPRQNPHYSVVINNTNSTGKL